MGWCAGRAPSVVAEGDGPRDSVIHGMARIGKVLDRLLPNISLEAVLLEPSVVPGAVTDLRSGDHARDRPRGGRVLSGNGPAVDFAVHAAAPRDRAPAPAKLAGPQRPFLPPARGASTTED